MNLQEKKFLVQCDFHASPECKTVWEVTRRTIRQTKKDNDGKIICFHCSRILKSAGRNNPNCKYKSLDDSFFSQIDTEAKAYLLGWIASDGSITKRTITIAINQNDRAVLETLRDVICKELIIRPKKPNLVSLTINSKQIVEDVCGYLDIEPKKKTGLIGFPELQTDELKWSFLRGYFDGDGSINAPETGKKTKPKCSISTTSARLRKSIVEFCGVKCWNDEKGNKVEWWSNNALDFLHCLYDNSKFYLLRKRERYLDWSLWVPGLSGPGGKIDGFRWVKTDKLAQPPFKTRASDSGYDLTLIEKIKTTGIIEWYTTGIKVQPPYGWYFDLAPRSSIVKTGYVLANSIGVIDRTYVGPILVPLIKFDTSAPDLELPARLVQIIPRPIVHFEPVWAESLDETERGDGGFGSTGTH